MSHLPWSVEEMLQAVPHLRAAHASEPTLFEITGYPHLENVSSNVLAFFLKPENPHGFQDAMLRALLAAIDHPPEETTQFNVYREESTLLNKRMDIIIETDNLVIGIEAKIYSGLDNDLRIYWSHLHAIAQGRKVLGIVMSLRLIPGPWDKDFHYITYEEVLSHLDMPLITSRAPSKYQVFLAEYIRTIRNLARGTTMEPERVAFLRQYQSELNALFAEVAALRKDMRDRLNALAEALQLERRSSRVKKGAWADPNSPMEFLTYTIDFGPNLAIQIDIFVNLSGWYMQFFGKRGDKHVAQEIIDHRAIPYRIQKKPWRLVYTGPSLPYEAPIDQLYYWASEIVYRLAPVDVDDDEQPAEPEV